MPIFREASTGLLSRLRVERACPNACFQAQIGVPPSAHWSHPRKAPSMSGEMWKREVLEDHVCSLWPFTTAPVDWRLDASRRAPFGWSRVRTDSTGH